MAYIYTAYNGSALCNNTWRFGADVGHSKALDDSVAISDALVFAVGQVLTDSGTLSASVVMAVGQALEDSTTISDALSNQLGKNLSDSVSLADLIARGVGKALTDSGTLSDSAVMAVGQALEDSTTISDALSNQLGKNLSDSVSLADLIAQGVGKALADITFLAESKAVSVGKPLEDSVSLGDEITFSVLKILADPVMIADVLALAVGKGLEDSATLDDVVAHAITKSLGDSATLGDEIAKGITRSFTDSVVVSEVILMVATFIREFSELIALSDGVGFGVGLQLSDTVGLSELFRTIHDIASYLRRLRMALRLNQTYTLNRAARYANPLNGGDHLPVGFGDLNDGTNSGVIRCPCIDTVNFRYLVLDHPINGNIKVYIDQELQSSGYTAYANAPDENGKDISYIEFSSEPSGEVTATCEAYVDITNSLVENLADIVNEFLTVFAGISSADINAYALSRSRKGVAAAGWKHAGVIDHDMLLGEILSDMLFPVGDYYFDSERSMVIKINTDNQDIWNVSGFFGESRISNVTATKDLANLANRVPVSFAYNNALGYYNSSDSGAGSIDESSQDIHGEVSQPMSLKWCRDETTVNNIQTKFVADYRDSVYSITFDEDGFHNLHLTKGDYAAFSWGWLFDKNLNAWKNRIVRVISIDADLNKKGITFEVVDSGQDLLTEPNKYDNTWLLDGSESMGGERDVLDYAA